MMRIACLVAIVLWSLPVLAQAQVTVEVRPAEIPVAPWDDKAEARVILHNGDQAAITRATLKVGVSNDGITTAIDPAPAPRLEQHDSYAWSVPLNISAARVPGSIELEVEYTVDKQRAPRHLYKTLTIKAVEGAVIDKPVEVTLTGAYEAVSVERPGRGYVVVANNLDVPARITSIRVQTSDPQSFLPDPDFDEAADKEQTRFAPFEVPARSSRSQFIELRASPKIMSGKHRVVLAVDAEWRRHGRAHARTLLLGQDVTLGVFFESEILEAISVPSFLLLPGALFLLTIDVLLKFNWGGPNKPTQWPKLEVTSPEFWVLAISWSGLFAWLYSICPGVDILRRYGAADLRNVWLTSIALGAGLYTLMVYYNRLKNQNRPSENDEALPTLEKLGARELKLRIRKAEATLKGATLSAFVVDESDAQAVWLVPPVELKWKGDASTLPAKQQIIDLVNSGSAADLVKAIAANKSAVEVDYNFDGSLQRPTPFKAEDIKLVGEEPIVTVS